jgi:acetolactate synthase-1/2/3 large subunit
MFAHRNAARTESGHGRFQPQRIAYFPEPAEEQLAGLRRLILVEARAPVSFFGYPGRRSTLAPEDCEILTMAAPDEDGTAALEALADRIRGVRAEIPNRARPERVSGQPLTAESIGHALAALMPEHTIVSDESISVQGVLWPCLQRAAPHDYMPVTGGSIGQGLPVALGAAVACPDRKVVALEADGSAMYTLQSLWTMARERMNVTAVIFANRRYRILDVEMERTGTKGFGARANDLIDIGRPDLDFVRLSEGLGVEASRATTGDEFADQFAQAMRTPGPRLIEALLD